MSHRRARRQSDVAQRDEQAAAGTGGSGRTAQATTWCSSRVRRSTGPDGAKPRGRHAAQLQVRLDRPSRSWRRRSATLSAMAARSRRCRHAPADDVQRRPAAHRARRAWSCSATIVASPSAAVGTCNQNAARRQRAAPAGWSRHALASRLRRHAQARGARRVGSRHPASVRAARAIGARHARVSLAPSSNSAWYGGEACARVREPADD